MQKAFLAQNADRDAFPLVVQRLFDLAAMACRNPVAAAESADDQIICFFGNTVGDESAKARKGLFAFGAWARDESAGQAEVRIMDG